MKYVRWMAVCVVVTLAIGTTALGAGAQSSNRSPRPPTSGSPPTEIHIAVIADVDNPFAPNLFKASVDGVKGVAKYINSKAGGGGLAGRKVVVDFYDSKLNPTQTTNAEIQACQNDVAMVGTSAVFLTSVDDMRNCKDSTGAVTGLPDIPFVSTALVQQCSDQSFPIAPPQVICSTKDQHPQTFQANVGARLLLQQEVRQGPPRHLRLRERLQVGTRLLVRQPGGRRSSRRDQGIKSDEDFDLPARRRSRSTRRSSRR